MERSRGQSGRDALDTLWTAGALGALTDGELLDHFRTHRDTTGQEAFRLLVERHGPMILGLCRSIVRHPHDAEDAFQATFLVLVRQAASIRSRQSVGPWLHGVAYRVARRAQSQSLRRRRHETPTEDEPAAPAEVDRASLAAEEAILEEIARLPEPLRAPLVICCLEGLSYDQAARMLGVGEPALRGRLHRARKRLAARLRGRDIPTPIVVPGIGAIGLRLPPVSPTLIETTTQLATRWASVDGLLVGAHAVPESIAGLAQGVIETMTFRIVMLAGFAVLLGGGLLTTMVVAQQGKKPPAAEVGQPPSAVQAVAPPAPGDAQRLNQKIREELEKPVAMAFPNPTPLRLVLAYIKQATSSSTFPGIPIRVEPHGLEEARQSLNSTVQFDREGLPLKTSLGLVLKSIGLSYIVSDGVVIIDSRSAIAEARVEEMDRKLDRVLEALGRLEQGRKDH